MSKYCTNKVCYKLFGNYHLFHSLEHVLHRLPAEPWHTLPLERIGIPVWFQVCKRVDKQVEPQRALVLPHHLLVLSGLELADLAIAAPGLVVPVPVEPVLAELVLVVLAAVEPDRLLSIRVHTSQREHPHRL